MCILVDSTETTKKCRKGCYNWQFYVGSIKCIFIKRYLLKDPKKYLFILYIKNMFDL